MRNFTEYEKNILGKKLKTVVNSGIDLPTHEADVMKLRGFGYVTIKRLHQLGLIKPPIKQEAKWHDGLSIRAQYCLVNAGYESKEGVKLDIESGRLNEKSNVYNYGHKTHMEVCAWTEPEPERSKCCPNCGFKLTV